VDFHFFADENKREIGSKEVWSKLSSKSEHLGRSGRATPWLAVACGTSLSPSYLFCAGNLVSAKHIVSGMKTLFLLQQTSTSFELTSFWMFQRHIALRRSIQEPLLGHTKWSDGLASRPVHFPLGNFSEQILFPKYSQKFQYSQWY
jgi:hypothetical protein